VTRLLQSDDEECSPRFPPGGLKIRPSRYYDCSKLLTVTTIRKRLTVASATLGGVHSAVPTVRTGQHNSWMVNKTILHYAALLPPPFPTSAFVIGAGVTRYPFSALVLSFGMGRVCRFTLLVYLASVFGRRFVTSVWSAHTLVLVAAFGAALVCVGLLAWLVLRKSEAPKPVGL